MSSCVQFWLYFMRRVFLQGKFFLMCKFCFEKENRLMIVRSNPCPACSHVWTDLLVHVNGRNEQLVAIGQRRFIHSEAFYRLCYRQRFCERRDACGCAHSPIERDVWYLQRDHDYTWQQIVDEATQQHYDAPIQPVCSNCCIFVRGDVGSRLRGTVPSVVEPRFSGDRL